jgi:acyl carrier protein
MTEEEILKKVQDVIGLKLSIDKSTITPQSKIAEDLGADSLDVVEITISLENAFNIEISDDLEIVYIEDLIKYIKSKIAG